MRNLFSCRLIMSLSLALLFVTIGCSKKPKLNLEGLQSNPPGTVAGGGAAGSRDPFGMTGEFAGDFIPGEPQIVPADGGLGAGLAPVGDSLDGAGGWATTDTPLDTGSSFLKNGSYWNDIVYFDYNRSEVRASERPKLDALAGHLRENAGMKVVIEGHCDERGSDEYNRALSERRSLSVLEYLGTLGIDQSRMHTVSYGEDRPVVPNATSEADHQKNRRAEFLLGDPK